MAVPSKILLLLLAFTATMAKPRDHYGHGYEDHKDHYPADDYKDDYAKDDYKDDYHSDYKDDYKTDYHSDYKDDYHTDYKDDYGKEDHNDAFRDDRGQGGFGGGQGGFGGDQGGQGGGQGGFDSDGDDGFNGGGAGGGFGGDESHFDSDHKDDYHKDDYKDDYQNDAYKDEYKDDYHKDAYKGSKYPKPTPYPYKTETPRTYPTPQKYATIPTYKHLPSTYPSTKKVMSSWTAWSVWEGCSVTCGVGIKKRTRECLPGAANSKPDNNHMRYARGIHNAKFPVDFHSGYPSNYDQKFQQHHGPKGGDSFGGYSDNHQVIYDNTGYDYRPGEDATGSDFKPIRDCEGDAVQIEKCSNKPCPISGAWSTWSVWSLCSATCGDGGIQKRTRECSRPAPAHGGRLCIGVFQQTTLCSHPRPCAVDGSWSDWTLWCRCSISCGFGGVQTRGRNCTEPAPDFGGKPCQGAALTTRGCCEGPCPIHGRWSSWSEYSAPAQTCGAGGRISRTRRCDNPTPADGGDPCRGRDTERRNVFLAPCPIDGCWSSWGDWSKSSASCGEDGFQTRSRACDGPAPQYDGKICIGDANEVQIVKSRPCPVDGGWTQWFEWTKCSSSCGFDGSQIRRRSCTKPVPAYDGRPCEGSRGQKKSCFITFCPIDGHWGEWSAWSFGNATCGTGGTKSRNRVCDSPSAQYGGRTCDGDALEHALVGLSPCPMDGGFSAWSEWSRPSDTCGEHGGVSVRSRTCTNPKPSFGGNNCKGHNFDTKLIRLPSCPVCGGWSTWSDWAYCSVTCGFRGVTTRHRQCSNPEPHYGGDQCEGEASQTKDCSAPPCPICGGWSGWSEWSACSASCGEGGLVIRERMCDSPAPEHGGAPCEGDANEKRTCTGAPCPVNGRWSAWGRWSRPSVSCGAGFYPSRTRACNNPGPAYGGRYCRGPVTSFRNVTARPCPIAGGWSSWNDWSSSTVTCGDGPPLYRRRACSHPEPAYHGKPCVGRPVDKKNGFCKPCPIDGAWGEWSDYSECSVTCGLGGIKFRQRPCNSPAPSFLGRFCPGKCSEIVECRGRRPCAVDGQWGQWSMWSDSSVSCGSDNIVSRNRNCDAPSPSKDGKPCEGESTSSKALMLVLCPVHGGFTEWTEWSTCSIKCGDGGTARRTRCCAAPEPKYGGNQCEGKIQDTKSCSGPPCGINGGWTDWTVWSRCSVSCGEGGVVSRTRTCTRPAPSFGGKNCQGSPTEYAPGIAPPCPINGGWADWVSWSRCSVTCGNGGESMRVRVCNEPKPMHGGKQCLGKKGETRRCAERPCPIDGGWGDWSEWSKPTAIYGTFIYVQRTRLCDKPEPQYRGKNCAGDHTETKKINLPRPPTDGGWSSWSSWSKPTASYGPAVVFRARRCNNPSPSKDGHKCIGESVTVKKVELKPSPVDGNWGLWCAWSTCSVTCGAGGTASRSRLCNEPKPLFGGRVCRGDDFQSKTCYVTPCEVDGGWTSWGQWTTCSATCAEGTSTRARTCQNPETAHGGRPCEGLHIETKKCNLRPCDINGNWNSWSDWAKCSVTCGRDGITTRNRKCNNPAPKYFGKNCVGSHTESKNCSARPCAIDGGWGQWAEWSACSKSCGYGGSTTRSRVCNSPEASFGGKPCKGAASEVKFCFESPCDNWSPWTSWSSCVQTCGIKPHMERNRQCLLQNNVIYGKNIIEYCEGEGVQFKYCATEFTSFSAATPFTLTVPGYGPIEGACVNSYFVLYARNSPTFSLDKTWKEFKAGFGQAPANFHVGNEAVYQLTTSGKYYAAVEVVTKGHKYHFYPSTKFVVDSESRDYALHIDIDSDIFTDGTAFSTKDRDNDKSYYTNCAQVHLGGFWYDNCYASMNLFGDYKRYHEMKSLAPDQYLLQSRLSVQRLPVEDDVVKKPYKAPKYPVKAVYPDDKKADYYKYQRSSYEKPQYKKQDSAYKDIKYDDHHYDKDAKHDDYHYDSDYKDTKYDSDYKDTKYDSDYKDTKYDSDYKDTKYDSDYKDTKYDSDNKDTKYDSDYKDTKYDDHGYDNKHDDYHYDDDYKDIKYDDHSYDNKHDSSYGNDYHKGKDYPHYP